MAPEAVLPAVVQTLPYVAVELDGPADEPHVPVASTGRPVPDPLVLPLVYQRQPVGRLVVGPRGPGEAFTPAELLEDLAFQVGVAAHAVRLTADLQQSRQRLVSARGAGCAGISTTRLGQPGRGGHALALPRCWWTATRPGSNSCSVPCRPSSRRPSATSGGWSTGCGRRHWTSWAWSGALREQAASSPSRKPRPWTATTRRTAAVRRCGSRRRKDCPGCRLRSRWLPTGSPPRR